MGYRLRSTDRLLEAPAGAFGGGLILMKLKNVFLITLLIVLLSGCATMTFLEVVTPFIEKYGNPSRSELYQTRGYVFRTWTWTEEKLMVTFVKQNNWSWEVDSIYRW